MKIKKALKILIISALISSTALLIFTYSAKEKPKKVQGTGGCSIQDILEAESNAKLSYDVLSPVGNSEIKLIQQAPRLNTLDGKTIAIVGGSFMASVTHPEIKRLILKRYPTAKVILLNEIGSAGPYPGQGVKRQQKDEFEQKLKEMKVDAVISGNGGCGLCTPKEAGSCITAEHIGIPSVMIASESFINQAKHTALMAGVPVLRTAEYPGAFSSHTKNELIQNTRNILFKQIIDGLTKPITEDEINVSKSQINSDDNSIVYSGTLEEVQQYFETRGRSDGLPIIPPTEDKVNEFYKYTPYPKDTVIAVIPPSYRKATVQNIAVNGVMAGCPPEYMPVLIAFTKAMSNGDFRRTLSSTHAWTPFIWINGPVARQLGIESGQGEISASKNKKLGRFIDLAMINLGGYEIKKNRMGTFGYLSSWAMAEDEQAAINAGWLPYHVQKGFDINESTLTATSALNWGNNLTPAVTGADKILELMAMDIVEKEQFALGSGTPFVYRTIFLTEYVAKNLAKKYKNQWELEKALITKAVRPLDERTYANYFANPGSSFEGKNYSFDMHKSKIAREEHARLTQTPTWLNWSKSDEILAVPVMQKGKTSIIVTGDSNRNKVLTVPTGGTTTIKIDLPSDWNELTKKLGYNPLESYYLNTLNLKNTEGKRNDYTFEAPQTQNNQPDIKKRPTKEQYQKMRSRKNQSETFNNKKRTSPEINNINQSI